MKFLTLLTAILRLEIKILKVSQCTIKNSIVNSTYFYRIQTHIIQQSPTHPLPVAFSFITNFNKAFSSVRSSLTQISPHNQCRMPCAPTWLFSVLQNDFPPGGSWRVHSVQRIIRLNVGVYFWSMAKHLINRMQKEGEGIWNGLMASCWEQNTWGPHGTCCSSIQSRTHSLTCTQCAPPKKLPLQSFP